MRRLARLRSCVDGAALELVGEGVVVDDLERERVGEVVVWGRRERGGRREEGEGKGDCCAADNA
jgi:hypothetical protein